MYVDTGIETVTFLHVLAYERLTPGQQCTGITARPRQSLPAWEEQTIVNEDGAEMRVVLGPSGEDRGVTGITGETRVPP